MASSVRRHTIWPVLTLGAALGAALASGGAAVAADAPVNMMAHYAIFMTHVRVGEITWAVYFTDGAYLASANGKASGVFSVLVNGEGAVTTHGVIGEGKLTPRSVTSVVTDDEGHTEVQMTYENGVITQINDRGPPPKPGRVQITPDLLHRITDPLSAMLIPTGGDAFAHANCDKTLRIFDGRRRYNLALSFKRVDKMKVARGYAGPALVCGVVLRALAGYDPDSLLVRYLAGKSDLELWFAPVAGASVIAPIRAVMPTLIGTLELRGLEFETLGPEPVKAAAPHPATPAASERPAAPAR